MYYDKQNEQWLARNTADAMKFGERLKEDIEEFIPAGSVVVYTLNRKPYMMFQTLQTIIFVSGVTNQTLIAYEPGSLIFMGSSSYVPTIRFRDCRMPTVREFEQYKQMLTI